MKLAILDSARSRIECSALRVGGIIPAHLYPQTLEELREFLHEQRQALGLPEGPSLAEQRELQWQQKLEAFQPHGLPN